VLTDTRDTPSRAGATPLLDSVRARWNDDVLILVPMVALFRIAAGGHATAGDDVRAGILLAVAISLMSMPARLLGGAASTLFISTHLALWLALLLFLARVPEVAPPLSATDPRLTLTVP
jgi:hypothetical protein